MEVKINTSPISYVGSNAIMTFTLSRVLNPSKPIEISETIDINLKKNGIGPFVPSRHYRKAITAMFWSEMTHRIIALMDEADALLEHSPEFEQAFNGASKQ